MRTAVRKGPRTAHGLWIVHEAIAFKRKRDPSFDWCALLNQRRELPLAGSFRHNYSNMCVICRCADRYCRRYKIKTTRQYNDVVDRICDRYGSMHNTREAAKLGYRGSARLVFSSGKKCAGTAQFKQTEVFNRRDRILEIRRKKEIAQRAMAFESLNETEEELRIIRRAIRTAQSALRSAMQ